jgi:hypothetical protein
MLRLPLALLLCLPAVSSTLMVLPTRFASAVAADASGKRLPGFQYRVADDYGAADVTAKEIL